MAKYKTKNGSDVMIPGVGVTENGEIETDIEIENPNLEKIQEPTPTPIVNAPPVVQPVAEATARPVSPTNQEIK